MALIKLTNGTDADADKVMDNFNKAWSFNILNKIRQNIDRVSIDSAGQDDIFTEAYVDVDGQNNSVNTTNTTLVYNSTDDYYFIGLGTDEAPGDTTHNPSSYTNPDNAFDGDDATYTSATTDSSVFTTYFGKTFSTKDVQIIRYKAYISYTSDLGNTSSTLKLQSFDGVNWTDVVVLGSTSRTGGGTDVYSGEYPVNLTGIQGLRLLLNNNGYSTGGTENSYHRVYYFEYGSSASSGVIEHDIPSGTYPSNVSKLIGKVLYANWESGVSIQHKLKNATEDSGWINDGELGTFTAFTSEPTQYVVKLIPRSTSPTAGYPSIKGAGFYTE